MTTKKKTTPPKKSTAPGTTRKKQEDKGGSTEDRLERVERILLRHGLHDEDEEAGPKAEPDVI